ncbi:MAG: FAD-binding oxidoreductase [Sedimenticola sp.]|nr:FAD-binding oxidoreductase [Sedimenticola sp.]
MEYSTRLLMSEFVTRDVKRFIVEKPEGFGFTPGQGVELAIDNDRWRGEGRPFTPTSLADDEVIEFIIKQYPSHQGVTQALHTIEPGQALTLSEPFGTIHYKGPGVFIAGGAGITPFIAIFRELARRNQLQDQTLLFSNKTPADIINEKEFRHMLGDRCLLTCTEISVGGIDDQRITQAYLESKISDFDQHFYVCGPESFMDSVTSALDALGAKPEALVLEQ